MRYDLAVIGSGQGGVPLALDFAERGKRVVLFERGLLGGTCVNVGCTPSKAFLASAHWAGRARRGAALGVHCEVRVDVPAVMARVRGIVADWHAGVERKLTESAVELVRAEASFDAPHVVRAAGDGLRSRHGRARHRHARARSAGRRARPARRTSPTRTSSSRRRCRRG